MNRLKDILDKGKKLRVIGFDDAPFSRERGSPVNIAGIICSDTRFEGMLWGNIIKDGLDSTQKLIELVKESKFYSQLHVVLIDGIAFGGFNILDLPRISSCLELPCIAVMRKRPDLKSIDHALRNFEDYKTRTELIEKAGLIWEINGFVFQVANIEAEIAAEILERLTDTGKVPEALRLAHLIGSAIKTGESSNRA